MDQAEESLKRVQSATLISRRGGKGKQVTHEEIDEALERSQVEERSIAETWLYLQVGEDALGFEG